MHTQLQKKFINNPAEIQVKNHFFLTSFILTSMDQLVLQLQEARAIGNVPGYFYSV